MKMESPSASSSSIPAALAASTTDGSLFTPSWRRARRVNDVILDSSAAVLSCDAIDGVSTTTTTTTTTTTSLLDTDDAASLAKSQSWWQHYPCLVCGKVSPASSCAASTNEENDINLPRSHHPPPHKRCSRCHSAIYCSTECQRQDYTHGKHRSTCLALGKLWKDKAELESRLWTTTTTTRRKQQPLGGSRTTNPFDDDYGNDTEAVEVESSSPSDNNDSSRYPKVGKFWHDHPQSTMEKTTTLYCVTLLQLVQLLGRGESWRTSSSRIQPQQPYQCDDSSGATGEYNISLTRRRRRNPGNPLSRELAIDIAYTLLQLDQTDMRVRLLIPSLLLEGMYYQEAYDFLKNWLHVDASLMIMDMALLGGGGGGGRMDEEGTTGEDDNTNYTTKNLMKYTNGDMLESPQLWMDGEMVYPSVGMVFELAFLKCHILCSLRSGQVLLLPPPQQTHHEAGGGGGDPIIMASLTKRCSAMGGIVDDDIDDTELEYQVKLLLSLVHKWNPYLLPKLAEVYDIDSGAAPCATPPPQEEEGGTTTSLSSGVVVDEEEVGTKRMDVKPATPPALSTLLNKHPPGFELQYKMGNPGGGSIEEAVAIWQRDMILWHVVDPMTMQYLSNFCMNLEDNLVDTQCLHGGLEGTSGRGLDGSLCNGDVDAGLKSSTVESILMRKEAEDLAKELQEQYPDRTMDEIMMHPDMAQLMIKHLHTA